MRPRERYTLEGAEPFGELELISLILGTGTAERSSGEMAAALLDRFGGLAGLRHAECRELAREHGVGIARAIRLHAAFELGRRALVDTPTTPAPIVHAADAHRYVAGALIGRREESLYGLYLDRHRRPVALRRLTRGSEDFTIVEPRQIYRVALAVGARSVILAHNHPSGDPTPSRQDQLVTQFVASAGRTLGIPLADHLIIGHERYVSFRESGWLNATDSLNPRIE